MERVLLICGSLQRSSANRAVLEHLAGRLTGTDVAWFDGIGGLPAFDPERADEAIDTVAAWRRVVADAAVVVIAVPEYAGGMAGAMKNATDWLVGTGELYRKPVVVLSAGTSGGEHARRQAVQSLTWQGAYVVAELGIAAPRTKFDDAGRLHDESTRSALESISVAVVEATTLDGDALVTRAMAVVGRFGIDTVHVAPA